jgi:hypothetical protein
MNEHALTLAGADHDQAAQVIRDSANTISLTIASMLDFLDEPLKGQFLKVKQQIDTMLASMPPSDQAPAALNSNRILGDLSNVLAVAQSMMSQLSEVAKSARQEVATVKASLTTEIENAIKARIEAGELFAKDAVQGRIDAAVKQARDALAAEQQVISTRRLALNSTALPVPADALLAGEDKTFQARQDTAKARAEALKPYKVPVEKLTQLCWNTDQAAFELALELLKENAPAAKPNGFIGQNGQAAGKTTVNLHKVCC